LKKATKCRPSVKRERLQCASMKNNHYLIRNEFERTLLRKADMTDEKVRFKYKTHSHFIYD